MAKAAEIDFPDVSALANLDVAWIHGSPAAKYNTDPDIQVHAYDEHTYILRQNMAVHYEAPFMFLLLGRSAALLPDTGATADPRFFPLRRSARRARSACRLSPGSCLWRLRCSSGCSRDAMDRRRVPRRGETLWRG
jgi:hypothetical protein